MKRGKYRVKTISKKEARRLLLNLGDCPNFHRSGSITGMKNLYYGLDSLLVRCGSYIYNCNDHPEIYAQAH